MVSPGDTPNFEFANRAVVRIVRIGNAGGVELAVNWAAIGQVGSEGELRILELTHERLPAPLAATRRPHPLRARPHWRGHSPHCATSLTIVAPPGGEIGERKGLIKIRLGSCSEALHKVNTTDRKVYTSQSLNSLMRITVTIGTIS